MNSTKFAKTRVYLAIQDDPEHGLEAGDIVVADAEEISNEAEVLPNHRRRGRPLLQDYKTAKPPYVTARPDFLFGVKSLRLLSAADKADRAIMWDATPHMYRYMKEDFKDTLRCFMYLEKASAGTTAVSPFATPRGVSPLAEIMAGRVTAITGLGKTRIVYNFPINDVIAALKNYGREDLLRLDEALRRRLYVTFGPEKDEEVRAVWAREGRLMAIKSYHSGKKKTPEGSRLSEAIEYVDRLCAGIPQGSIRTERVHNS